MWRPLVAAVLALLLAMSQASATAATGAPTDAWTLPETRLPDLQGTERSLEAWRGKVILLNFWASWCAPCQYEIPDFVRYQRQYGPKGLQIVGVGVDQARKLANVARTLGINYPVLVVDVPRGSRLMREWGNKSGIVPYSVLIDRKGSIRYVHRGRLDDETFQRRVVPLLQGVEPG